MTVYDATIDSDIRVTAKNMVALAEQTKDTVTAEYNGIPLTTDNTSMAEDVVEAYYAECAKRTEAYRNSPEGKIAAHEASVRLQQAQERYDTLVKQLPDLNFNSDVEVLNWLDKYQEASDRHIVRQPDVVFKAFVSHGYQPNINMGKDFDANDRDNFARYIIGQALNYIEKHDGSIHQIVGIMVDRWKQRFVPVTPQSATTNRP